MHSKRMNSVLYFTYHFYIINYFDIILNSLNFIIILLCNILYFMKNFCRVFGRNVCKLLLRIYSLFHLLMQTNQRTKFESGTEYHCTRYKICDLFMRELIVLSSFTFHTVSSDTLIIILYNNTM